jgi:LysM repeat protein
MAFSKTVLPLLILISPLFLTQCKTVTKSYKDVSYDPAKLKTPAGHGMEKKDYPFDESGNYRKDWVKENSSGRDRSANKVAEAPTEVASTTPASSGQGGAYPTYAEASASRNAGDFVGPAGVAGVSAGAIAGTGGTGSSETTVLASAGETPAPATPAPASYHKVASGDTLFSLAGRYHTSVSELKRVNGLSGDSIRTGQSLRIP